MAVQSRRDANNVPKVPKIIIDKVEDDNDNDVNVDDDDDESSFSNDSDDPSKSKIFSQIQQVKFVKSGNEVNRSGDCLSKEEAEKCIQELKNIVADFEKCTMESISKSGNESTSLDVDEKKDETTTTTFSYKMDASSVGGSDSDDSDSLIYEYQPLTSSFSDLRKSHCHTNLIRIGSDLSRRKSLETVSPPNKHPVKKVKSLDFEEMKSVKERRKIFEGLQKDSNEKTFAGMRNAKNLCQHDKLKIVDKYETRSNVADPFQFAKGNVSPSRINIGFGKVAALTKHFSKMGDAGLIKFLNSTSTSDLKTSSESFLNCSSSKFDFRPGADDDLIQTVTKSAPDLSLNDSRDDRTSTHHDNFPIAKKKLNLSNIRGRQDSYDYDYSLIYSLGMKKIGFSLDNLLGYPAENLLLYADKTKSCSMLKQKNEKKMEKESPGAPEKKIKNLFIIFHT